MPAAPRVLVVDDDTRIAAAVRRALAYDGYAVDLAHDGRSALAQAAAQLPDLVLLDLMLPDIDGIEVCRRLRAEGSDIPILMLTARDATSDRVHGLDAGADDYLVKPFAYENSSRVYAEDADTSWLQRNAACVLVARAVVAHDGVGHGGVAVGRVVY